MSSTTSIPSGEASHSRRTALYEARIAAGLSAEKLAGRAGISAKTVYAIERGTTVARDLTRHALSRALGCEVEALFPANEERPVPGDSEVRPRIIRVLDE